MPYDFTSVTHAGPFEHAIDSRKPTVSSKYPGVYFSDHYNLSIIDVRKLRALYDCPPGKRTLSVNRTVILVATIFHCTVIFLYQNVCICLNTSCILQTCTMAIKDLRVSRFIFWMKTRFIIMRGFHISTLEKKDKKMEIYII